MRIDKYLKTARIVKRREAAKELAAAGRVMINGRKAKAGSEVNIGDILSLQFGNRLLEVRVADIQKQVSKANSSLLFEVLKEEKIDPLKEGGESRNEGGPDA